MHLITTQYNDHNKIKNKKVYLSYLSKKNIHEKNKNIVLEYNWKNINLAKKDSKYIFDFHREILNFLKKELNIYQQTSYNVRYWEILIGPWVYYFLTKYFDHYKSIKRAFNKYKKFNIDITNKNYIPHTYIGFARINGSNYYNSLLCEEIILNLYESQINKNPIYKNDILINLKYLEFEKFQNITKIKKRNNTNLSSLKKTFKKIILKLSHRKNKIALLSLASSDQQKLMKIVGKENFIPFDLGLIENLKDLNPECDTDFKFRFKNNKFKSRDHFKKLVYGNIFKHIPKEYLENYKFNNEIVGKFLSKDIKLAIIRVPTDLKTFNRFFLSKVSFLKGKILSMQHGGSYGARDIFGVENLEIKVSDKYLTWGWKSKNKKVHPFFVTKNNWIKKYNYNQDGNLLFVGASCKNFFYSFDEGQLPNHNNAYLKNSISFIKKLDKKNYKELIYRFYFQGNFNEHKYIKKIFPNIKISLREQNTYFYDLLYNSKLLITTNDATTHKEGFILNHPTIILLDYNFFNFRKEAKKYYQALYDAEILFNNPIKCAKKVNSISDNPQKWWQQKDVQRAKNFYNDYFCKINNNYNNELAKIIKNMI